MGHMSCRARLGMKAGVENRLGGARLQHPPARVATNSGLGQVRPQHLMAKVKTGYVRLSWSNHHHTQDLEMGASLVRELKRCLCLAVAPTNEHESQNGCAK